MKMTDNLRKQLESSGFTPKKITALLVFSAIILVFVLFGFQGKHTAMGVGSAARVNDALISVADLQSESQRMEQMYGQYLQMGGEAMRQQLRGQALESLITGELISQAAKKQGILVTDAEVRDFIVNEMPVFQKDGHFQRDLYVQILEANHLSPADFEERIRKDRKNQRIREVFEVAAEPSALELEKIKELKETKFDIGFVRIDEDKLADTLSIPSSEVTARLADPEFAKKVEADFAANKARYSTPDQVRASHILIKSKPKDEASEKAALAKIQAIKKRSEKEDFGKLAASLSEDSGSQKNKGDLGFFSRGKMVPEFDQAAFSQPVGKVGEPIKTTYGYHLIKVTEKKPGTVATLENTKEKIAKKLIAKEKIAAATKTIEAAVQKGDEAGITSAIKSLGLAWDETGYFDLSSEAVPKLNSQVASQAAFELSPKKTLLDHLVHDGSAVYVLKFNGVKKEAVTTAPADAKPAVKLAKNAKTGKALAVAAPKNPEETATEAVVRERSGEMFGRWMDQVKKTATIEKNPEVLHE
jgi:peptidyl-prolyl cis-trans isomerase D